LEAVDKGVLEEINNNALSIEEVALKCNLNIVATQNLLGVLATMSLIKEKKSKIVLTAIAKKWLLKESPQSLYWLMIFDNRVCTRWMDYTGSYLQSGKGLQYHETFSKEEWFYYQKAMEAVAKMAAEETARKLPVPAKPLQMLDIGGAHGLYSLALCNRYPSLSSTILDLPGAVEHAATILQKYNVGNRITYKTGNVLTEDDLGENKYDFILMASVAHHFTASENILVIQKAYKALKPGGVFTIMEILKPDKIVYNGNMLSALGNMFFALSSTSGAWSLQQIKDWQNIAGLRFYKKHTLVSIPGYVCVSGIKK
jgi:ubiquinone/menaquinone biosynthesis C-methylase UbiE